MKRLLVVVGTRPNFMKVTRFKQVAATRGDVEIVLVHTGQHADDRMSTVFFEQFGMRPDHALGVPPGSPTATMARIMLALEPVARDIAPDAVVVVGDVNSTFAAALTANKMGLPLVHLESGLRSGDMGMPEEVNRILTDRITQVFLVTEPSGRDNLLREGADPATIHHVGNTMIDTLVAFEGRIQADPILREMGLAGGHALMTMHRPATVDDPARLKDLLELIAVVARRMPVVFPVHPRTTRNLEEAGLMTALRAIQGVALCEPLAYFAFQKLVSASTVVITDSGGIQEETTFRGIPCLTLRPSTERPVTVTEGTNELMTFDPLAVSDALDRIAGGSYKQGRIPDLWDGAATERALDAIVRAL
ncbi:MAG: UDP-N-acetylglucosamine 2-epimerase (non-hydrolyzing) [Flavobacteriales bacterium]|nr:UDP-N-acetylglucosamine 2-epimerase (non-hydrolyzing) [Flavobacteriales bacterium]